MPRRGRRKSTRKEHDSDNDMEVVEEDPVVDIEEDAEVVVDDEEEEDVLTEGKEDELDEDDQGEGDEVRVVVRPAPGRIVDCLGSRTKRTKMLRKRKKTKRTRSFLRLLPKRFPLG